jgi:hypothetical protein
MRIWRERQSRQTRNRERGYPETPHFWRHPYVASMRLEVLRNNAVTAAIEAIFVPKIADLGE